nr:unnamed protein product [Digitaria exilis]
MALADGDSSSSSWDSDDEYQKLVEKMNPPRVTIDNATCANATIIHVDSANKYGILLEVVQVLTDLKLIVKKAYISSDGGWFMDAVIQVTDRNSGLAISDAERLGRIKERLRNVFKGRSRDAKTTVAMGIIHRERRLHQMMLEDRDYERYDKDSAKANPMPMVSVVNWLQKDYSVVTMRCKDRPKLLFDTVCTLTDMQYVVYHGSVDTEGPEAYQEYYIRHIDGSPVNSEAERKRIIQYLEAAIERRVSEGLKLELSTGDRVGLLSDVTRIFRENGLTVTRAEVSTKGNKAVNTFYVRDTAGSSVELKLSKMSSNPVMLRSSCSYAMVPSGGIVPEGYSEGAVVKCDTTTDDGLSKESGRRRHGCHLCRAHMSKMAASSGEGLPWLQVGAGP